jgi:hypothetical protein
MDAEDARTISARARMTRCRCRLNLDRTAKLAGITKCHLSMLELGQPRVQPARPDRGPR